jgi:hypothetical protein
LLRNSGERLKTVAKRSIAVSQLLPSSSGSPPFLKRGGRASCVPPSVPPGNVTVTLLP